MNQSEARKLAERIQAEQEQIEQLLMQLDQLLDQAMRVRAEMRLAVSRVETLRSLGRD